MAENVFVAHFSESNLTPVAMCEQVLHGMKPRAKQAERLPKVWTFVALCAPTMLDAGPEGSSDESCRSIPPVIFCCHVFLNIVSDDWLMRTRSTSHLHSSSLIYLKFLTLDRWPKPWMEFTSISFLFSITPVLMLSFINIQNQTKLYLLRIVDMFLNKAWSADHPTSST